jgi:two-component system, cell cycle sensor histidine kinase PleC
MVKVLRMRSGRRPLSKESSTTSDKNIVDRRRKRSPSSVLVRHLRQRIPDAGDSSVFEPELMFRYAESHRNAFISMPIFAFVVAAVASGYVGFTPAVWWFLITSLSHGLLAAICYRYMRIAHEEGLTPTWRWMFLTAQILIAFCWSIFAIYGCSNCTPEGSDTYSTLQFATIMVLQAITMIMSYGFGANLLVTSAPPTIALSLRFLLTYDPAHMLMGGVVLGSLIFFSLMADRFKLSVISILAHKAEKETLIAELETAKSMSEEARRRAEEANLAKSRFLATMSHELRTPLNAILGFSEVMQTEVLGPINNPTYKEYVTDIHNSGNHLLNVINEILDLSRIEAGRHELQEEPIRLVHVVSEAIHMVQLRAKNKGIVLTTQFEENLPQIWADERSVRQITLNLLSNALKFTPSGGNVWVKVGWTTSGGQYLSVKDTGPGIPEEEIPIVLSTFGQGSIAIKSAEQGTGLGLPIVQALMHMHDGKFEIKSRLREGTEVIATFPRTRVLEVMRPVPATSNRSSGRSILPKRKTVA